VLRAIAAACSLSKTASALGLAELAKEEPEKVVEPNIDEEKLRSLVEPVSRLLDDRSGAPGPDQSHRFVAAAIGADAVLVAKAHEIAENDPSACDQGLLWVAQINAGLLDPAARAAAMVKGFTMIPDQLSRLEELDSKVQTIEGEVQTIEGEVQTIYAQVQTIESTAQTIEGQVQTIEGQVQTIDERVTKLETSVVSE
jgi:hypothetical protein